MTAPAIITHPNGVKLPGPGYQQGVTRPRSKPAPKPKPAPEAAPPPLKQRILGEVRDDWELGLDILARLGRGVSGYEYSLLKELVSGGKVQSRPAKKQGMEYRLTPKEAAE